MAATTMSVPAIDERQGMYWYSLIAKSGWCVSMDDEHEIGQRLPYAMKVINVNHTRGTDYFSVAASGNNNILGFPVIVYADELKRTAFSSPSNRQSDGNTYIYRLHSNENFVRDNEQNFSALPTGLYTLEVMIPLFRIEKVVLKQHYGERDRVSTSEFVYDSQELEEGLGFMGLLPPTPEAPRGRVWKLVRTLVNVDDFEREMCRRAWVMFDGDIEGPVDGQEQIDIDGQVGADELTALDHLSHSFGDDATSLKNDGSEIGSYGRDEPVLGFFFHPELAYRPLLDDRDAAGEGEVEDTKEELLKRDETPLEPANKRKRSHHDDGELLVCRGGKRMRFDLLSVDSDGGTASWIERFGCA